MRCDQCEMLSINGLACHETGCPNSRKTWDEDQQRWIRYVNCDSCGYTVEEDTECDCNPSDSDFEYEQESEDEEETED